MNRIVATALFLGSFSVSAAVYRTVDPEGNVIFTDQPASGAEEVELPPVPTYQAPRYRPPASRPDDAASPPAPGYRKFAVVSPAPDETVRDNPGNVTVVLAIEPDLDKAAGDRIQIYLDGKPVGKPTTSLQAVLSNVDRGEHRVSAAIVDRNKKTIRRTEPVRFFLHRQSRLFPRGPKPPAAP